MPARVVAETTRPPVAIPKHTLNEKAARALALRLRASELRYQRAGRDAVRHHEGTRMPAP